MIKLQPADEPGLDLDAIQIDGGTQSRANVNQAVVSDVPLAQISADNQAQPRKYIKTDVWMNYQEAMERGDIFPPVTVFHDGTKYWLADGFHRFYAARGIGRTEIRCEIHQGGLRDAVLYSVGVNHAHGLQRTDADRRRAIMLLLEDEEWGTWSDREIARRCKVHHTTVARVKADIRAFYQGEARDAGGKYRPGREAVFDDPRVERITGDVASDSRGRKFRSKHGTVATMKTAGINAGRKTGGGEESESCRQTVAPQGIAGGDKAENRVPESCPTDPRTEAEREADAIQSEFDRASDAGRALFLTRNNLRSGSHAPAASSSAPAGRVPDESPAPQFQTKADEEAEAKGAATVDPVSRADEDGDHQRASGAGPTDGRRQGGVECSTAVGTPAPNSEPVRKSSLRPLCRYPGDDRCGGYGSVTCHACLKAAQEGEAA